MRMCSLAGLAAALVVTIAGCGSLFISIGTFDNTGGDPPPGDAVSFQPASFAIDDDCRSRLGALSFTLLARTEADIPVIGGDAACSASLRTALSGALAALTPNQAIGIFSLVLGGCVRSYEVAAATLDVDVVRPWVLLHDTTLGAVSPRACTADAIIVVDALRFDGVGAASMMQ